MRRGNRILRRSKDGKQANRSRVTKERQSDIAETSIIVRRHKLMTTDDDNRIMQTDERFFRC